MRLFLRAALFTRSGKINAPVTDGGQHFVVPRLCCCNRGLERREFELCLFYTQREIGESFGRGVELLVKVLPVVEFVRRHVEEIELLGG